MPNGFSFTAQMQLTAPNLKSFTSSVQNQLNSINGTINVKLPTGAGQGLAGLNAQAQSLKASLGAIGSSNPLSGVSKAAKSVTNDLKDAGNSATQFGELIGSSIRKFSAFSIAAGSVLSLVTAIKDGTKEALEFQREMIRLEQVGGNLGNAVGKIASEIARLSTTFGTSSAELSKVAVTLRQAGLSADDTKTSLDAIAKTTLAPTFSNINNTVEGTVAVMQQFNVQAKDLTGVLGSVNAVSAAFAVESDDIVHAVRRSGGAFKAAGGNLNELISLFTSVRQTTRESAETIASGFNTIFARVQRGDTVEKLKELGINLRYGAEEAKLFGKTEGDFIGPYEAVRRLNTALKSVPPASAQYAAIVEELGGFRQVSKVIPLIQQFGKAEQALGVALGGTNSLTQSSIIAQKGLLQQVSVLKEEFLDLFRVIGSNKGFQDFAETALKLGGYAITLVKALAPLAPLLTTIAAIKIGGSLFNLTKPGFVGGVKAGLTKNNPITGARGLAKGGPVPGTGNKDETPIFATPGEFMVKKSSAQSIGYKQLHEMNRTGKIPHYAEGGEIEGIRKNLNIQDRTGGKNVNRVIIRPPGGKVAMLVTGTQTKESSVQTPVVPIDNLGSTATKIFNRDKAQLVSSGALTQADADGINNVTVPLVIRSPQAQQEVKAKTIIENTILDAIDKLGSIFSAPTAGISLSKKDSQNVLHKAITSQGIGRIFEGFLQAVSLKTKSSSNNLGSARQNFDFNPINEGGLVDIFGSDLTGIFGDAKLNDTQNARASLVSKSLKAFGISKDIGLSALHLDKKAIGKKGQELTGLDLYKDRFSRPSKKFATGGIVPGQGNMDSVEANLMPGEFVMTKKAVESIGAGTLHEMNNEPEKFATGGKFGDGYDRIFKFDRSRTPRLRKPIKSRSQVATPQTQAQSVSSDFDKRSSQTFTVRDKNGNPIQLSLDDVQGLAEGTLQASKLGLSSQVGSAITSRLKKIGERPEEGIESRESIDPKTKKKSIKKILSVPFKGDSIGAIGVGALGKLGPASSIVDIGAIKASGEVTKILRDKGLDKLNVLYNTYGLSDQPTADFNKSISGPIKDTIAKTFQSRFGGDPTQYQLTNSEVATVDGYMYEKYVRSISGTKFENVDKNDLTFDYPNGLGNDNNFSKVVIPHPVRSKYVDAKYSTDETKIGGDLARKYFNLIGPNELKGQIARFAIGGKSKKRGNALLTPGEYVFDARSASQIGYGKLGQMNRSPEKFARGGRKKKANRFAAEPETNFDSVIPEGIKKIEDPSEIFDRLRGIGVDIPNKVNEFGTGNLGRVDPAFSKFSAAFEENSGNVYFNKNASNPIIAHELGHALDASKGNSLKFSSEIKGTAENIVARKALQHLVPEIHSPSDIKAYDKIGVNLKTDKREAFGSAVEHFTNYKQSLADQAAGKNDGLTQQQRDFYQTPEIQDLFGSVQASLGTKPVGQGIDKISTKRNTSATSKRPSPLPRPQGSARKPSLSNFSTELDSSILDRQKVDTRTASKVNRPSIREQSPIQKPNLQIDDLKEAAGITGTKGKADYQKITGGKSLKDVVDAISGRGGSGRKPPKNSSFIGPNAPNGPIGQDDPEDPDKKKDPTKLDKLKERFAQFGPTAAILASQFGPQITESVFGTPETQKKGKNIAGFSSSAFGAGIGGAASEAGLGATAGAVFGPFGVGIGAAIGAIHGFTAAASEAEKKIREIQIDKDLDSLGKTIERVVGEEGKLSATSIGSISSGFQKINRGLDSEDKDSIATKINSSQIQSVLTKAISTTDFTGKETDAERQGKIQQAGNGVGGEALNILARLPENASKSFGEVFKQFDELAIKVGLENQRAKSIQDFTSKIELQTKNFDRLGQAVQIAALGLEKLDSGLNTVTSLFEGNSQVGQTTRFSSGASQIGTPNVKAFEDSVDLVTNSLKGAGLSISEDFGTSLKGTNQALKALPSVLGALAKEGALTGENNENRFRSALDQSAPGVPTEVKRNLTHAFGTISDVDINKNLKDSPQKLIDEITSKLSSTTQALDPAVKALEGAINTFATNLNKYQDLSVKAEEAQHKIIDVQTEGLIEAQRTGARRAGFKDATDVPTGLLQAPFNVRQQSLAGVAGENAFNPNILGARLKGVSANIESTTQALGKTNNPTEITKLQGQLSSLGGTSNKLRGALEHLADAGARNASLQERRNKLLEEESQRLNIAERYAGASPQERAQQDFVANAASHVAQTGNLEALPTELRQAVLQFSHEVENLRLPGLGNQTGGEFRQRILQTNANATVAGFAANPINKQQDLNSLDNQIAKNYQVAAQAQTELAASLTSLKDTFFNRLQSNQQTFLQNLTKGILESEVSKQELGKIPLEQERGKVKSQTEAASTLQGLGVDNAHLGNIGNLAGNADLSKLSEVIKKQQLLSSVDQSKLGSGINDFDTAITQGPNTGAVKRIGLLGTIRDQFPGSTTPAQDDRLSNLKNKIRTNVTVATGGKLQNPSVDSIVESAINSFLLLQNKDRTPKNLNQIVAHATNIEAQKGFREVSSERTSVTKDLSEKTGFDSSTLTNIATNLDQFNSAATLLGNDFNSLADRGNAAEKSLQALTESVTRLQGKIDQISQPSPQAGTGTVLAEPKPLGFASGGSAYGPRGTDKVPAYLTAGEVVINKNSASQNMGLLGEINRSKKPLYAATGGLIKKDELDEYIDDLNVSNRESAIASVRSVPTPENQKYDENEEQLNRGQELINRLNRTSGFSTPITSPAQSTIPETSVVVPSPTPLSTPSGKFDVAEFKRASAERNLAIARAPRQPTEGEIQSDKIKNAIAQKPNQPFSSLLKVANQFRQAGNLEDATRFENLASGNVIPTGFPAIPPRTEEKNLLSPKRTQQIAGLLRSTANRDQKSFTIQELRSAATAQALVGKLGASNSSLGKSLSGSTIGQALQEENRRRTNQKQTPVSGYSKIPSGLKGKARFNRLAQEYSLNNSTPLISVEEDAAKNIKNNVQIPSAFAQSRRLTINDLANQEYQAYTGINPTGKKRRQTINSLNQASYQSAGFFAAGGIIPGQGIQHDKMIMVHSGEAVIPALHTTNNKGLVRDLIDPSSSLNKPSSGKNRYAIGGIVDDSAGNTSRGNNSGGISVGFDSKVFAASVESFGQASSQVVIASQAFNALIAPLNQMIAPLTQFNASSAALSVGLIAFSNQLPGLIDGLKSLASIPSTIQIQGSISPVPINVNVTQEISAAVKQQIIEQVITSMKSQLKSGDVLG